MLTTPHETPSAYPGHMRTIKNFINLIAFGFFLLLVVALVVAVVTGQWQAAAALVLFVGIACPNCAKQAKRRREAAARQEADR